MIGGGRGEENEEDERGCKEEEERLGMTFFKLFWSSFVFYLKLLPDIYIYYR